MTKPYPVKTQQVFLSASIGVATADDSRETSEGLHRRARMALDEAKRFGGGVIRYYCETLETANRDLEFDCLLHEALDRNEFEVVYQPILDLESSRIIAAEALLRWQSPVLGTVNPLDFLPVAEDNGLMVPIGAYVLRTACRQLRSWLDRGLPAIRMAVNVSVCQLRRGGLAAEVAKILAETEIDPSLLELELSERGLVNCDLHQEEEIIALKSLGIRLAIDDFGTGDSAVSYLKRLPIDSLKVDATFVRSAPGNESDAAFASSIVTIAHRMNLEVNAEGVESEEQLRLIRSWGCDRGQGFLFSKPVQAADFAHLLARGGNQA